MCMVKVLCLHCGESFVQYNPRKIYCSDVCVRKAYNERNRELRNSRNKERYNAEPEYRKKVQDAIQKSREANRRRKDSYRFGGNREKALIRDNYTCKSCGTKENLDVHHIDKSGQTENPNNELSNLVTLCKSCHNNQHKHDKPRTGQYINCAHCGEEMYTKPTLADKKRFCSKSCKDAAHTGEIMTSEKRNCEVCGTEFIAQQNQIALGKGKYCSQSCSSKAQSMKLKVNCITCGSEFETIPAKIRQGKGKFCSKPCYYKSKAL